MKSRRQLFHLNSWLIFMQMTVSLLFSDKLAQQQEKLFSEQIISYFPHWVNIQDLTLKIISRWNDKPRINYSLIFRYNFKLNWSWYTQNSNRILWIDNLKKSEFFELCDDNFLYFNLTFVINLAFEKALSILNDNPYYHWYNQAQESYGFLFFRR